MKRIALAITVIACVSTACFAAPDSKSLMDIVSARYPWLPTDETPVVTLRPDHNSIMYDKNNIFLVVDDSGNIGIVDWHMRSSSASGIYYSPDINTIWAMRPDLPRDKMVTTTKGWYRYIRPDGIVDPSVYLIVMYDGDKICGFYTANKPSLLEPCDSLLPLHQARSVAQDVAQHYVYADMNGSAISWPYIYEQYPERVMAEICKDVVGSSYPVYDFVYRLTDKESINFDDEETLIYPILNIRINAITGEVLWVIQESYKASSSSIAPKTTKPVTKLPAVDVVLNAKDAKLGFPLVVVKNTTYIAMPTLQSLAKGHAVAAKAGAKAFSVDGKQLALDAKILDRKGVLYLPWQSLNNLPGVKAQFDAKLAKLSITTTAAQNASAK